MNKNVLQKKNPVRILTFDIEEWFHLLDIETTRSVNSWCNFESRIQKNMDKILQLLRDCDQKATFFCLGWVAEKYPQIIHAINKEGYEIGSHTYYHQLAYQLTPSQFREDLQKSIDILENLICKKIRSFRVPGFSITRNNLWAFEIIAECGIQIDSSVFPAPRGHGGLQEFNHSKPTIIRTPSGDIKEFPINTINVMNNKLVFSGGGYFRLLPYPLIHWLTTHSEYVMSYFHPRDFDQQQPVIEGLSITRRFKSYIGLKNAYSKLKKLLDSFQFTDINSVENIIHWPLSNIETLKYEKTQTEGIL